MMAFTHRHILTYMYKIFPKSHTHTKNTTKRLPIRASALAVAPARLSPQGPLSSLFSFHPLRHPRPPYLKSQSLQYSPNPFAALFSSKNTYHHLPHFMVHSFIHVLFSVSLHWNVKFHDGRDVFVCLVHCCVLGV